MATLPTRSFNTIVSNIAAGMQGRVPRFLNFAVGSALRATNEAVAGVLLWMQGLILEVAKLTRLSTSFGADVDTFIADFFGPIDVSDAPTMQRLAAQSATGNVIFARLTASASSPVIPVGSTIQTADGKQNFQVTADTTNGAYSALLNAYVMPAQVPSVIVPVEAIVPGAAGNIAAGTLTKITSSIQGVDTVTNPADFINGIDEESDDAVKRRFRLAIASLSKGTDGAIQNAVQSLRAGMEITIQDNVDLDGTTDYGMVTVVVDDGSGNLSSAMLAQCQVAINAVRAASIRVGVYAATPKWADVSLIVEALPGYFLPDVQAAVAAKIALNINSLGLGNDLEYFAVAAWAKDTLGVAKISNLTVNGGVADLVATPLSTIKARNLIVD